jgi:hypothetical protein
MPKKYCGSNDKLPSGYDSFGNMKECIDNSQVRRYGIKKVNTDKLAEKKKKGRTRHNIIMDMIASKAKMNKLRDELELEATKKRLGKLYDKDLLKQLKIDVDAITKIYIQFRDEFSEHERTKEINALKGGKLKATLLKELFEASVGKQRDVQDYKIDRSLSTKWVRVYHNDIDDWTIIVHRGSNDLYDAMIDTQLSVNFKNNARFKESKKIQKLAEKKYDPKRMSVVGSSLGGVLASTYGANAHEIITSGRPVTPADLVLKKKPHDHQFDVRTPTDIVSFLKPLQPHKNDLVVKSNDPLNPLKSHLGKHVMEAVVKEKGTDAMIGHGKSMKIAELKKRIIVLRKYQKDKSSYLVTGKNKKELIEMLNKLLEN